MESDEILARLHNDDAIPSDWTVLPILRAKLVTSLLEWLFGIIIGAGLFALIASIVIPSNYERGVGVAIFSTILLGICLFIAVSSLYLFIVDILRLSNARQHRIVLTPDDFLKQTGKKIIHVPMVDVRYVTSRGKPQPQRTMPTAEESSVGNVAGVGENISALFVGRGMTRSGKRWRLNRMRTPASVAFIDSRSDKEVLVLNDTTFGDPFAIGTVLKEYASSAQAQVFSAREEQ